MTELEQEQNDDGTELEEEVQMVKKSALTHGWEVIDVKTSDDSERYWIQLRDMESGDVLDFKGLAEFQIDYSSDLIHFDSFEDAYTALMRDYLL